MFCKNCGEQISEQAYVCPKCGVRTGNGNSVSAEADAPSAGFAVLGFFIPLVGLILWAIWKDSSPLKAKSCGKGALIGFIASVAFTLIYSIAAGALIGGLL